MMRARKVASVCCGAAVGLLLSLAETFPAGAQSYPLPPWYFYGGGNGSTWNGSSTSPENAQLEVTLFAPPFPGQYGMAVATGSTGLGQITPLTTYTLTFWALVSGLGSAQSLWADGVGTITSVTVSGLTWKCYTNSFALANPDDPRVGRNLNVQLLLSRFSSPGTVSASFTNIQLQVVTARPTFSYRRPAPGTLQLLWPTNFYWYVAEQVSDFEGDVWESMTNEPTVQGDKFMVETGVSTGQRFFRLRQP